MTILKDLRVEASKTQEELASLVGVTVGVYQHIEQDPEYASPRVLVKLCKLWGLDMDQLFEGEDSVKTIEVKNPYSNLFSRNKFIKSYLADFKSPNLETRNLLASTLKSISLSSQKPNLGVMGRSDSGKSHFINTLLGSTALPAQLQPTTSAVTIIRHVADKPSWQSSEHDVLIFKDMVSIIDLDDQKYCIDPARLYAYGGIELLSSEIVHDHFSKEYNAAYSCVVYIDSAILNACNIIDAPGFANTDTDRGEQSDTSKALSMLKMVDVLVYMSPVTGCMDHTDMASLRTVFKTLYIPEELNTDLPLLSNLFIVTSQAAPHIKNTVLDELIETASSRIINQFNIGDGTGVLEQRGSRVNKQIDKDVLKKRWYSFWSSTSGRCDPLIDDICHYLENGMPETIKMCSEKVIGELKSNGSGALETYISNAENHLIKYELLLEESKKSLEPMEIARRFQEIEETKSELLQVVERSRITTNKNAKKSVDYILELKNIEELIKNKYKGNKDEAQEYAAGLVIERLQTKVEKIFSDNIKSVEQTISERLESCSVSMNKLDEGKALEIPFDVRGAFTGTAIGATLAFGLGAYATTLGALGGYAVAAQGVGILSSLGMGFAWSGGTAGIMSGMAAIGGPVTVTLAIAVGVALLAKRLFGDSWQRRLSKQMLKVFEEERVAETLLNNVNEEFAYLEKVVTEGSQNLKVAYHEYISHMQNQVENPIDSRADLVQRIDQFRNDLSFFVEAPWAQA